MKVSIELKEIFHTSLERAFKAPILGDATRFLDGYGFQPPVTGFEADDSWGQENGIRYPVTGGNFWVPAGRLFTDKILERNENKSWKWVIDDFKIPLMFFTCKAVGEWTVAAQQPNRIAVIYTYTFYAKNVFFYPFTLFFCQIQWKGMMQKALKGIKNQAESTSIFVYE